MNCPEILRTQAWLDGELHATTAAEAERHADDCAECRAFIADVAGVSDTIERYAKRWQVPPQLRARVMGAIGKETGRARFPLHARTFWFGAASGAGLSALAAAVVLFLLLPLSSSTLVDAVTDAHTRALMNHRAIAVVSSNHHTVKPWFAGRVDVSPPVADFAAEGFALAGGRVDRVAGLSAAVVVYRHGAHEIDLFAWADKGSALPREAVRHGYRAMFWKNDDLAFAAISDVERGELARFVQLVRGRPE